MSKRTEIKQEKNQVKKTTKTINNNKDSKNNEIPNETSSNSIFLGKKILNFRPPKKELEEESLSLKYIIDESQSFQDNAAITPLSQNNINEQINHNNNINKYNNQMYDKKLILNTETKTKNNNMYDLALAYTEKNILEELKRFSVTPLNNINNANSLYNQKLLLKLIKSNL